MSQPDIGVDKCSQSCKDFGSSLHNVLAHLMITFALRDSPFVLHLLTSVLGRFTAMLRNVTFLVHTSAFVLHISIVVLHVLALGYGLYTAGVGGRESRNADSVRRDRAMHKRACLRVSLPVHNFSL